MEFWGFLGFVWIFGIFGRIRIFDDFLTGPRSAKNFRSRIFDGREIVEKSIFLVGDHFPRPYDANFLRPGNGRKIDFSGGGPHSETSRCQFFKAWKWPKNRLGGQQQSVPVAEAPGEIHFRTILLLHSQGRRKGDP